VIDANNLNITGSMTDKRQYLPGNYRIMKLHKIPAQIADPITPDALQAIACINK
jgi:hypothetical protein